ncbi:AAA family ATPase [Amylibacter sp. SFDW26]|uniref:Lon protease family protein n=1 Tax=Amylibacter sp. SFDW26 TaxID=2652722 RepID=UPI001261ED21|nr:ATP-binding protein [Amylibacter sp. SFDW26]KAB7614447.1 AAA family ATPase [Amylibacter sp. SFDW26]
MLIKTSKVKPLKAAELCATFKTINKTVKTDHMTQSMCMMGHSEAVDAIKFSARIKHPNFNLFALGQTGCGRHRTVMEILRVEAQRQSEPSDWVYVHNFETPHKPIAIQLPAGQAIRLKKAMQNLVDDLANEIPALFQADAYQNDRRSMEQEYGQIGDDAVSFVIEKAKEKGLALLRTPMGFIITAMKDDQPIKPHEFSELPDAEKELIEADIKAVQEHLEIALKQIPENEKNHRRAIEKLNSEVALGGVESAISDLFKKFGHIPKMPEYLAAVKRDLIENAEQFLNSGPAVHAGAFPVATTKHYKEPQYYVYAVNIIHPSDATASKAAPVITEDLPTLSNLVGHVEHFSEMGAILTDHTMIRPGALHRANGGFLVLDIRKVLTEPFAWDALKRCIKSQNISIISAQDRLSLSSTISLEPDPIPLNIRFALVGDRRLYYLLAAFDPEFLELFKVQADFDDSVFSSDETIQNFTQVLKNITTENNLLPLSKKAISRLLVEATRLADDAEKLSLNVQFFSDTICEANFLAVENKSKTITDAHISTAIEQAESRANRPQRLTYEAIDRDTLLIETSGDVVGQINALSVLKVGDFQFGRPSRLTARVRAGKGKVVDIEREVELGGPLHSKGVLILSSYLATHFALDVPMSLWASIVFEQSYGGVDGDSASAAELFALISALSECAIDQSFAVTGSINQFGKIQPIGGINEKIEGFFDVCASRALTGTQGVIMPKSNIKNLALRPRVIEAVKIKKFHIFPIETVDEGIELLMNAKPGMRDKAGQFQTGTINHKVEMRLLKFADQIKKYQKTDTSNDIVSEMKNV